MSIEDWENIGYTDGMAVCTNAIHSATYPTQDKHPPMAESLYLTGYQQAIKDFHREGYNNASAYIEERNMNA